MVPTCIVQHDVEKLRVSKLFRAWGLASKVQGLGTGFVVWGLVCRSGFWV